MVYNIFALRLPSTMEVALYLITLLLYVSHFVRILFGTVLYFFVSIYSILLIYSSLSLTQILLSYSTYSIVDIDRM